jgi:hypothetical protein
MKRPKLEMKEREKKLIKIDRKKEAKENERVHVIIVTAP